MACLSQQQLVQVALAPHDKTDVSGHLDACPVCRARVEAMRGLVGQLAEAHRVTFDEGHEKSRAALMAVLPARDEQIEIEKPWTRIIPSLGGLSMRQRTVVGSIGAAAALALLVFWLGNAPSRVSAMERMAENIRRAKSYKATWDSEYQLVRELGKPPVTAHATSTVFWHAPRSFRMENKGDETLAGQDDLQIFLTGKPGIDIDTKNKTFRSTAPRGGGRVSSFMLLEELGKFSGQADQTLGTKEIDGKQARGFEIDANKIDPDSYPGKVQIWIDTESQLPVLMRYEFVAGGRPGALTMRDFHWNIPLDPKLFDPTPPEGYTDATQPSKSLAERVQIITEGLKIYAEFSGGHYPRGTMVYGDVTRDEIFKMIGIKGQPTPEQNRSDQYVKAMRASLAATHLNEILRDNTDAAYHGKTVEPKDADKILVRWELENGQYQVIYGDLRSENVTAERLRELEGK